MPAAEFRELAVFRWVTSAVGWVVAIRTALRDGAWTHWELAAGGLLATQFLLALRCWLVSHPAPLPTWVVCAVTFLWLNVAGIVEWRGFVRRNKGTVATVRRCCLGLALAMWLATVIAVGTASGIGVAATVAVLGVGSLWPTSFGTVFDGSFGVATDDPPRQSTDVGLSRQVVTPSREILTGLAYGSDELLRGDSRELGGQQSTADENRSLVPMSDQIREQSATEEFARGTIFHELPARMRECSVHCPFVPAFSELPAVEAEDTGECGADVRVGVVYLHGVRFDVRRAGPIDAACVVELSYVAVAPRKPAGGSTPVGNASADFESTSIHPAE